MYFTAESNNVKGKFLEELLNCCNGHNPRGSVSEKTLFNNHFEKKGNDLQYV